jgi:predicted metal-dependent phosphoesterase TrpH/glycosyltransferase involved in cell wall biosynthesis
VSAERFRIAQVTPYAWEQPHEVNRYVERLSAQLRDRGHEVVVVAPSESRSLIRESRAAVKRLEKDPDAVFTPGAPPVLAPGQAVPVGSGRRSGALAVTANASRTVEQLMDWGGLDIVHVHEPFAPGVSSVALRHSRALNVGTFHSPAERVVSTQVVRKFFELFFGRLDGRTASFRATAELLGHFFPSEYEIVPPGADPPAEERRSDDGLIDIVFLLQEERPALRIFLRALRKLPPTLPWRATVWSPGEPIQPAPPLARAIRDRVHLTGGPPGTGPEQFSRAHIMVAASTGTAPSPQMLLAALAAGAVPVASRLPEYEELLREGELGLLFMPRDADTLAAQITRLIEDPHLRGNLRRRVDAARSEIGWDRVTDRFEEIYHQLAGRRHPGGDAALRERLSGRSFIEVDLHMHTDHSHDCATPVPVLLARAREVGLGAIAVTDHNEVSGARAARALQEEYGVKVIVSEEVKTADQGEVIGLFIEDRIERGMTLEDTIAEIKRQGGLVYVPHPFDRMHSVPDYEHLLGVVEQIDAIEVFNARVAIASFNEEAARFAAKYRIVAGAGSDSHVPQGLGSVRIRMRDFEGPDEFLESLREADIVRRKQSLLYVQALKFLQTRGPSRRQAATGSRRRGPG